MPIRTGGRAEPMELCVMKRTAKSPRQVRNRFTKKIWQRGYQAALAKSNEDRNLAAWIFREAITIGERSDDRDTDLNPCFGGGCFGLRGGFPAFLGRFCGLKLGATHGAPRLHRPEQLASGCRTYRRPATGTATGDVLLGQRGP